MGRRKERFLISRERKKHSQGEAVKTFVLTDASPQNLCKTSTFAKKKEVRSENGVKRE